ncbi:hypothetical protein E2N92_12615 [Methanofollis formosanus]|uniref:Uncharacterized protein n=1 Tax=Methanofollis formosanus TaxID=299308 RepID=A0A8G1A3R9_9EURY|nr:hypothetical protein [Methanofollis formosanus]QYZ80213.1 hypothetical protein E2N92_12615 [Methanofollis formosanus]
MKMILAILSSGFHESLNSLYPFETYTQRIENSSDGSTALNRQIFPAISRRGKTPDPHDEDRWGRRWNTIPPDSPVLNKEREQTTRNFHPVCLSQGFMPDSTELIFRALERSARVSPDPNASTLKIRPGRQEDLEKAF